MEDFLPALYFLLLQYLSIRSAGMQEKINETFYLSLQ